MQNPGYATGHVVMGEIFRDTGMLEKAEHHCRDALRLDPGHPRAHLLMDELHFSRGESSQAAAAFEAAALSNPQPAQARTSPVGTSGEIPGELEDGASKAVARHSWRPGERPAWLTSERFEDLVGAVHRCRAVEGTILASAEGLPLASSTSALTQTESAPGLGVQFATEARDILRRLGAGRLRTALICGVEGNLACLSLGDLTLVATLKPDCPVGAAREQLEEVLSLMPMSARHAEKRNG
jgi:predicted regulator of Ras-like GTPase activity (Roadblock/LC7/MglB family)